MSIFPKRSQYFPTLNTLKHKNHGIRPQFSFRNCLLKFSDCELTEILECQLLSLTAGTGANHCPPKLTTKLPNLSKNISILPSCANICHPKVAVSFFTKCLWEFFIRSWLALQICEHDANGIHLKNNLLSRDLFLWNICCEHWQESFGELDIKFNVLCG